MAAGYSSNSKAADELAGKLNAEGLSVSVHQGNVGEPADCERVVAEVLKNGFLERHVPTIRALYRAQRDAMEHAQQALRKLAAQAHGEALTQLLTAWEKRDAELLPSIQELGGRVSPAVRTQWAQALQKAPSGDAAQALLRLEIASEVPTPADHLSARRMLQLQMLTRRNALSPEQTWGEDAAAVLESANEGARARRLQNALKALLRKV